MCVCSRYVFPYICGMYIMWFILLVMCVNVITCGFVFFVCRFVRLEELKATNRVCVGHYLLAH